MSKISDLACLFVKPESTREWDTTGNGATPLTKEEHQFRMQFPRYAR